ncbi:MAG: hypothetical protein LBQ94_05975 [Treponema sp.]|jgi:hypothetical protein|nr:hypothetical protein [Treponema sp.]
MYKGSEEHRVEPICNTQDHITKVLALIKENFLKYFNDFLTHGVKSGISEEEMQGFANLLGIEYSVDERTTDKTQNYKSIIKQGIDSFNRDRNKYLDIFDQESLEEYQDDAATFKSRTFAHECPIVNSTLQNRKAKDLDKYRSSFKKANAKEILSVVTKLVDFAGNYASNVYNPVEYDSITDYTKLFFDELDTESCTVNGVIGGGIKSHILYKLYPSFFPNRSRMAMWALWYLTGKKTIGCRMDSEFLMIDTKKSVTHQNYFYPYKLFAFYAHQIYQLLKKEMGILGINIDLEFRYVVVDSFLNFVAFNHIAEINELMKQIKDSDNGYE